MRSSWRLPGARACRPLSSCARLPSGGRPRRPTIRLPPSSWGGSRPISSRSPPGRGSARIPSTPSASSRLSCGSSAWRCPCSDPRGGLGPARAMPADRAAEDDPHARRLGEAHRSKRCQRPLGSCLPGRRGRLQGRPRRRGSVAAPPAGPGSPARRQGAGLCRHRGGPVQVSLQQLRAQLRGERCRRECLQRRRPDPAGVHSRGHRRFRGHGLRRDSDRAPAADLLDDAHSHRAAGAQLPQPAGCR